MPLYRTSSTDKYFYGILKGIGVLLGKGEEEPYAYSELWEAFGLSINGTNLGIEEALKKKILKFGPEDSSSLFDSTYYLEG